jgi:hypothetical protein
VATGSPDVDWTALATFVASPARSRQFFALAKFGCEPEPPDAGGAAAFEDDVVFLPPPQPAVRAIVAASKIARRTRIEAIVTRSFGAA